MGLFRRLSKIFFLVLFALLGACAGLVVFTSLMIVRAEGSSMLPEVEPGDRLVVLKESLATGEPRLEVGDLVIYESPFYTTDGEGLMKIRRITGNRGSWLRLGCDAKTVTNQEILARRDEILGKVIFIVPCLGIF